MADQETILAALRTVNDPELHVNVVDLGLCTRSSNMRTRSTSK